MKMLNKIGMTLGLYVLLGGVLLGYYRWLKGNRGDYNSKTIFVIVVAPAVFLMGLALFEAILDWFGINF